MTQPPHRMDATAIRYRAFVSYSHQDSGLAGRLHRKLEGYRLPRAVRSTANEGAAQQRIRPIFRDRDELASAASLTSAIEAALDDSAALIVVCSPAAVASRWVNEEIRYFRQHHPDRPVLAFIAAGDPGADPRRDPARAAFPLQMVLEDLHEPAGNLIEPVAADARREGDGFSTALLKLIAGLLDIPFDRLRQREQLRRQQRWMVAGSAGLILAAAFAVLAWRATVARNEARAARALAELELTSERQTREFLLSVFQLADPGEARGSEVSVREVLDRAVARIDSTEFARPVIKSRFLATMGQAYSSLGLSPRSVELLRESLATLPVGDESEESRTQRIDSQLELADVLFEMGDYEPALESLRALEVPGVAGHLGVRQQAEAANIRGDIHAYLEEDEAAMAAYRSALALIDTADLTREEEASIEGRSLGGIAILHHFAGEFAESERYYEEAVDVLLPVFGELHPDTIWGFISWGSAAYSNGDTKTAREAWTRALALALKVLDEANPEVGTIKNNLARLLLETGADQAAEDLLRDALAIDRSRRSEDFDDLAFTLNNLALVRLAQGDRVEAAALLREALPIAEASNHSTLGAILGTLADIECQEGQAERGAAMALRAYEMNTQAHGPDDWRNHQARLTLGYCLVLEQRSDGTGGLADDRLTSAAAEVALDVAMDVSPDVSLRGITDRWKEENYFTRRAREQHQAITKTGLR